MVVVSEINQQNFQAGNDRFCILVPMNRPEIDEFIGRFPSAMFKYKQIE